MKFEPFGIVLILLGITIATGAIILASKVDPCLIACKKLSGPEIIECIKTCKDSDK